MNISFKINSALFKLFLLALLLVLPRCEKFKNEKIRLHTIGDSTMEQQDPNIKEQRGWPQMLQAFFTDDVEVVNHGKSGASSKSYYQGGYWERAKKDIRKGDYVLIQFGHNDEKHDGLDGQIGTAATDSFRIYLAKYVNETRKMGAYPIFLTPVVRKMFGPDGKISRRGRHDLAEYVHYKIDTTVVLTDTISYNYPDNMKIVAQTMNCPLIDMTGITCNLADSLGFEKSTNLIYNLPNDGTHFGASGALLFSSLAARELKKQNILSRYIKTNPGLVLATSSISFGNIYTGTTPLQAFDVCYLGENISGNNISLSATPGFDISLNPQGPYSNGISLPASSPDKIKVYKVYVKALPDNVGAIKGIITVTNQINTARIALTGEWLETKNNQPAMVCYKLSGHAKAETNGAVMALDETWNEMELKGYKRPFDIGIGAEKLNNTKMQCITITGENWPEGEIDVVNTRFIQFAVETADKTEFHIDSVGFYSGGGLQYRVVCSGTKDFSNPVTLGEVTGQQTTNTLVINSFSINQKTGPGNMFYLRIYPWNRISQHNQQLLLYKVCIKGVTRNLTQDKRHKP